MFPPSPSAWCHLLHPEDAVGGEVWGSKQEHPPAVALVWADPSVCYSGIGAAGDRGGGRTSVAAVAAPRWRHHPQGAPCASHQSWPELIILGSWSAVRYWCAVRMSLTTRQVLLHLKPTQLRSVSHSPACHGQVWDEWSELTPDTVLTHFMFSIPLDAPPSFSSPALRLRWLLRFRFTSAPAAPASGGGWGLRLGGSAPAPEEISWTLPLTVLPPGAGR